MVKNPKCFIEVIDGIDGSIYYQEYPLNDYYSDKRKMYCKINTSLFHHSGIDLNISSPKGEIKGRIKFTEDFQPVNKSLLSPGIMGIYSFVPNLKSYISIISVSNRIGGYLKINDREINFNNGSCSIQKNWGKDYPESWIWISCHTFTEDNTALLLTISKDRLYGINQLVSIGYFHTKGKKVNLSKYAGTKITNARTDGRSLFIELENRKHRIDISVIPRVHGEVLLPSIELSERKIKESSDATIHLNYYYKNKLFGSFEGIHGGLNVVGDIISDINELIYTE